MSRLYRARRLLRATNLAADVVLNERLSADGQVRWQARRSRDRGRLVVVGIVAPSTSETLVEPLNERELLELLEGQVRTVSAAAPASSDGGAGNPERRSR